MTDEKDKKDNVVQGPWGEQPENNGEWIKDGYDNALEKNTTTLKSRSANASKFLISCFDILTTLVCHTSCTHQIFIYILHLHLL